MRRRNFIAAAGTIAVMSVAPRRYALGVQRAFIGLLSPEAPGSSDVKDFLIGMQELGYIDGKNLRIEYRLADGDYGKLSGFAEQLVGLGVDVIVAFVTQASLAAKKATNTTPIVMVGVADPITAGLINSLAHPGGNVTGTSSEAAEIVGKQLEMLKQMTPKMTRVAALWNPENAAFQSLQVKEVNSAAEKLDIELRYFEARQRDDFDRAFGEIDKQGLKSLIILVDPLFAIHVKALVDHTLKARLITITGARIFADRGGLMSYGPSYFALYKQAASYVDKILKGEKPGEIPVEQPTIFELVINLRAAKSLGLEIPASLLARADEVIE